MERIISEIVVERIKAEALVKSALTAQRFILKDGREIVVGREPDIGIYDSRGEILVAIEIKGGTDTPDALERPEAALKSLSQAKRDNPNCTTILVVLKAADKENLAKDAKAADKENLAKDAKAAKEINYYFTKDELTKNPSEQKKFFDLMGI